jgi:hypothetical protein
MVKEIVCIICPPFFVEFFSGAVKNYRIINREFKLVENIKY